MTESRWDFNGINSVDLSPAFQRDLKRLRRRFPSIDNDLSTFIKVSLRSVHVMGLPPETQGHYPLSGMGLDGKNCYIAKKFACRSLKGSASSSGIRLVYCFDQKNLHLLMIELFYKGDKALPDADRIRQVLEASAADNE